MKASDAVEIAYKEIGVAEYPANSNDVKYNTWYYGKAVSGASYPWCAAFISWIFRDYGLCKKTASCADMLAWFEKRGQIVKNPQAGDIVFFKYSTNSRKTNHVGLVVGVKGNLISTVEGNTSITSQDNGGAVMQRMRNSHIVAYARPLYEDAWITCKQGDKNEFVRRLQYLLNKKMKCNLAEDGDFGNLTKIEVVRAQALWGIEKDGIAGRNTWGHLL